jgi:hypothetical protein
MPAAAETAVALYFYGIEPSMTAIGSRPAQQRSRSLAQTLLVPGDATFTLTSKPQSAASPEEIIPPCETRLTQADIAVGQLCRMQELDADWDGGGAARPLAFSLKEARAFIRALAPESIIPRATLHADGHAILFLRSADTYAELEFLGNNRIGFYARWGGDEWSDEFHFDGRTLPQALSNIGFTTEG